MPETDLDHVQRAVIDHYKEYINDGGWDGISAYDEYQHHNARACLKVFRRDGARILTIDCDRERICVAYMHVQWPDSEWAHTRFEYENPKTFAMVDLLLAHVLTDHEKATCPK